MSEYTGFAESFIESLVEAEIPEGWKKREAKGRIDFLNGNTTITLRHNSPKKGWNISRFRGSKSESWYTTDNFEAALAKAKQLMQEAG